MSMIFGVTLSLLFIQYDVQMKPGPFETALGSVWDKFKLISTLLISELRVIQICLKLSPDLNISGVF